MPTAPVAAATSNKVVVLDAGSFVSVSADRATVGEVIAELSRRLGITFVGLEEIDTKQILDGTRIGPLKHVLRWIAADAGFLATYREGDKAGQRAERVAFLPKGERGTPKAAPTPAAAQPSLPGQVAVAPFSFDRPATGRKVRPSADDVRAGKPDIESEERSEVQSVAEQLTAALPASQLERERQALDPTGEALQPPYLSGAGNAAGTTLEQQMQRSQALATAQLKALMGALKAACSGGPC